MIRAAVGAVLAAIALVCAPTAQASPSEFLLLLRNGGINYTSESYALAIGLKVCGALANGYTPVQVALAVGHDYPSLTDYQTGWFVGAAIRELC